MVDINGASKHERYEKIWLESLGVMNVKAFAMQDCWPAKHVSLHISLCYSYEVKKKKKALKKVCVRITGNLNTLITSTAQKKCV